MTQDEIIRMAREAGFSVGLDDPIIYAAHERFAALVAAHEREKLKSIYEQMKFDAKVEALAEQAEQEPVDHIGIKHDAQLVETFLRCPITGKQLYFASEPIQKKGMNFMRLQDGEGNDWTLIARLDEGWDCK